MKPIHPFPARMAPEILQDKLHGLGNIESLWDPMCGSGTSLRVAALRGIAATGTDTDPLAVRMARVGTRNFSGWELSAATAILWERIESSRGLRPEQEPCIETRAFKEFWFAEPQRTDLASIATQVALIADADLREFFEIALSRTIITKFRGASLAWDVSHSRPHRMRTENDFDVRTEFLRSCHRLTALCLDVSTYAPVTVDRKDARTYAPAAPVDLVVTSPPYLNAIDYMRGHKLSLVWMGWTIPRLRELRSNSIGTERLLTDFDGNKLLTKVERVAVSASEVTSRIALIIRRYIHDCAVLLQNIRGNMASVSQLILVVADSNVRGYKVNSARLFEELAKQNGLRLVETVQRAIPSNRRYLPASSNHGIGNRMKQEWVIHFAT